MLSHTAPNPFQAGALLQNIVSKRSRRKLGDDAEHSLQLDVLFNCCLSISGSSIGSIFSESTIGEGFALPNECAMKVENS